MPQPFVKWAGGKRGLIPQLVAHLPLDFAQQNVTYIEPFAGGGAMLFYMLEHYPNINRAVINDINPALYNCYMQIQGNHLALINELRQLEHLYYENVEQAVRWELYLAIREEYNQIPVEERQGVHAAALFIFLNKTCFNGLYRENQHGGFNVPFGKYVHPRICNEQVIIADHEALQNVEIHCGNYDAIIDYINWNENNFFYFDPPYRPLLGTKNFKDYTRNAFGDPEQEALEAFCEQISENGGQFMLSNSDSERVSGVPYFDELYDGFNVHRIFAPRTINAFVPGVQMANEVLITNY